MVDQYLNKYIHDWNLKNCEKLASTFTSDVYVVDSKYGKAVLKILNEVGVKDELPGTFFLIIAVEREVPSYTSLMKGRFLLNFFLGRIYINFLR
ncbi:MAG: hypothetical protein CME70_11535 [Halobacteriovorax sp.]|nr:hypothetical protein [Halobacteriovorax sp.]|tara:strand:- start:51102 stop:51383 length:282 start_codon:yes stop_codon:yes gene_type:complete